MSMLTDAVIHGDYISQQVRDAIVGPLPDTTQQFAELDTRYAGGAKVFSSRLYAAAFNYYASYRIVEWFLALPWGECDDAVLHAADETGERTVVVIARGKPEVEFDQSQEDMSGRVSINVTTFGG